MSTKRGASPARPSLRLPFLPFLSLPFLSLPFLPLLSLLLLRCLPLPAACVVARGSADVPPRLSALSARLFPAVADVGATFAVDVGISAPQYEQQQNPPAIIVMFCTVTEAQNVRR